MQHRLQIARVLLITSLILVLFPTALTNCKVQSRRIYTAKSVTVCGAVKKPGSYILKDGDTITVPKALELAGGLTVSPSDVKAVIVRHKSGSPIFLRLIRLLVKKAPDNILLPGDSLILEHILLFDAPLQEPNRCASTTISWDTEKELRMAIPVRLIFQTKTPSNGQVSFLAYFACASNFR